MAICCSEKRENGRTGIFVNIFLAFFTPNTYPLLFFRPGDVGERTGKGRIAENGIQCQRWSWSTVAGGKWIRSPSLTADEHGLTEYFQTSEKAVGTALKVPSERWVEKISHGTWKSRLEIDYGRYEPFLTWTTTPTL